MDRTYLFVAPEESAEVRALGAQWDAASKRWYIGAQDAPSKFSRWLPSNDDDVCLSITSSEAYVASAQIACHRCGANIEVICIHCGSGTSEGEPLSPFTVSSVYAMDEALETQLRKWPTFRWADCPGGSFTNHCPQCGVSQEDMYLHSEPDSPFFDIPHAARGSITLTPLTGTIRLSGDEHFTVD